jgi:hypothetical protein
MKTWLKIVNEVQYAEAKTFMVSNHDDGEYS